jgi:hypothetical protein
MQLATAKSVLERTIRRYHRPHFVRSTRRGMAAPSSFDAATRKGWKVAREYTVLSIDKRHRHGTLLLQMAGRPERLMVSYVGSVKAGFQFSGPRLAGPGSPMPAYPQLSN